jgi:hypothetical protein
MLSPSVSPTPYLLSGDYVRWFRSQDIADIVSLIELAVIGIVALGNLVFLRVTAVKHRISKTRMPGVSAAR